jgi:hypothetical protein
MRVALLALALLLSWPAQATHMSSKAGDVVYTQVACKLAGVKTLVAAAAQGETALDAALAITVSQQTCVFSPRPFPLKLLAEAFTFEDFDAAVYQAWKAVVPGVEDPPFHLYTWAEHGATMGHRTDKI